MTIKIGIVGFGFVGKATSQLGNKNIIVNVYDVREEFCSPLNCTLKEFSEKSDIIFICVPTPMNKNGSCHLGIVESCVKEISSYIDITTIPIVLRSTVPIGTAELLNCFFMPEFLTEKNAQDDFKNTSTWIFGLKPNSEINLEQNERFKELIKEIIKYNYEEGIIKYDTIEFMDTKEAEAVKLFRNTFLATKVGFCNEFYSFCQNKQINYNNVIAIATQDPRITDSHTSVPGHDGKMGFGGTCFPKDISSLKYQMEIAKIKSPIVNSVIYRNNMFDRPEMDWNADKGRAVVNDNLTRH